MKSTNYGSVTLALPLLISRLTRGAFMKKWVFGFVVAVVVSAPNWVRADQHITSECRVRTDESVGAKADTNLDEFEDPDTSKKRANKGG